MCVCLCLFACACLSVRVCVCVGAGVNRTQRASDLRRERTSKQLLVHRPPLITDQANRCFRESQQQQHAGRQTGRQTTGGKWKLTRTAGLCTQKHVATFQQKTEFTSPRTCLKKEEVQKKILQDVHRDAQNTHNREFSTFPLVKITQ